MNNDWRNAFVKLAQQYGYDYPRANGTVDGRTVMSNVPNMGSIGSSLVEYEILQGIRELPMSDFTAGWLYAADDVRRAKELSMLIQQNNQIAPLIVVIDKDGPYILEGVHRFEALAMLKANSFPAVVVVDKEDEDEYEPPKPEPTPDTENVDNVDNPENLENK